MDRRSLLVGLLAGGWVGTLLVCTPFSPFRSVRAEDPPTLGQPPKDPLDPSPPGRTVNSTTGTFPRGTPNPGGGTACSNQRAIALAASIGSGESAVYYFDTDKERLLVYQYRPGDRGGLKLLAARHFDYDLKLEEYRDLSEKTRDELKVAYDAAFAKPGGAPGDLPAKKVEIPGPK